LTRPGGGGSWMLGRQTVTEMTGPKFALNRNGEGAMEHATERKTHKTTKGLGFCSFQVLKTVFVWSSTKSNLVVFQ